MSLAHGCRIVTLLTDFGNSDWYVASMKGVILKGCPGCTIVDITHDVSPGDVFAGAFLLRETSRYFPGGTVHLAVVDPGVGTTRRALAAKAGDLVLVGPDNGLLSLALGLYPDPQVREIRRQDLFLQPTSHTFHGRDVFAPVAAYLACGGDLSELGPEVADWVRLDCPAPRRMAQGVEGRIVYIDRFGNGITNIPREMLDVSLPCPGALVKVGDALLIQGVYRTYGDVPEGEPVALVGSSGFLEIAVRGASARECLGLNCGHTRVLLQIQ